MTYDEGSIKEMARVIAENDWAVFSDEEWERLWLAKCGPSVTECQWRPVRQAVAAFAVILDRYDIMERPVEQ